MHEPSRLYARIDKMTAADENTRRVVRNTFMLYVRMLFSMLVSLYTSRLVLNTLGVEDYGIYNAVGGLVAMFSMVSSSLSSAVSRFLTFELGRGDMEKLRRIFSTSVIIQLALVVLVCILAETLGLWFMNTHMTIPPERLSAANHVFQASVVSFVFGLFSVPYIASIVSHEKMGAFAYIGILDVVLRLCAVLFIAFSELAFDRLSLYAILLVAVSISMQIIYIWYCHRNFNECRLSWTFDKNSWKEMFAFAGWNFIGCIAGSLKDQGVNILLNVFTGPVLNAARGIAGAVNSAVVTFANNFMKALEPQITKSYASGNYRYSVSLAKRGSRFSYYIVFILSLPLMLETDFILTLWLKHYPEHAVSFVRLILGLSLVEILSNTLIKIQLATGNIRNYQLAVGGMLMLNFPLSYACLKIGLPPESTVVVAIFVSICCMFLRVWFLRRSVGMSAREFFKDVCLNVAAVTVASAVLPVLLMVSCSCAGWPRFLLVTAVSLSCSMSAIYYVGCTIEERSFLMDRAKDILSRFRCRAS